MTTAITQKITGYSVVAQGSTPPTAPTAPTAPVAPTVLPETLAQVPDLMHESLARPEALAGATFKIKSPLVEHALYVTINDIVLNAGTPHEQRHPFEIFINSKNMEQFQWIVALTRVLSAVFRKGGDVTFLVDEMKAVFDPRGGYFKTGGVYMSSIVAEIGVALEQHLKTIGLITTPEMDAATKQLIADKRAAFEAAAARASEASTDSADSAGSFPPGATLCDKCNSKALVLLDGCQTCLNCGFSKCG